MNSQSGKKDNKQNLTFDALLHGLDESTEDEDKDADRMRSET